MEEGWGSNGGEGEVNESLRLGRIAGVRVGVNASVLVIVLILVIGLAAGRFPALYPGRSQGAYVLAALIAAVLFLASLLAHEIAHAVVARRNGIEVERIVLWLFGGVAQLRGEPRTAGADFRIAVVGPLVSVVLAVVFGVAAELLALAGVTGLPIAVAGYLAAVNLLLAVFNLVPAAPLDGGRVLRAALWRWKRDRLSAAITAARAGRVFGFLLVALGLLQVVSGTGLAGLWLVLIGLFLVNAAAAEEQQTRVGGALHGVRVGDVMAPEPTVADGSRTLTEFIAETALTRPFSTYPLVDPAGRLVGLVTLNRIRAVPPPQRASTRLIDVSCPPDQLPTAHPEELLTALLPRLGGCGDGRAVVIDDRGIVVGVVSPSDISRVLQLADLGAFDPYPVARGADVDALSRFQARHKRQ